MPFYLINNPTIPLPGRPSSSPGRPAAPGLSIEAVIMMGSSQAAIREARESIITILHAPGCDAVKLAALDAFKNICEVKNPAINNCNFKMGAGS